MAGLEDNHTGIQEEVAQERGDNRPKRERWTRNIDFLLACVGFSVGLGNVWRFPYLCYKNGGGAFLIPYLMAIFLGGIPLFFLEVVIGQLMNRGGIEAWNIIPICKGLGVAQIIIDFYLACYYNVILAWAIFYFFTSFQSRLPWSHCENPWNSPTCTISGKNNASSGVFNLTDSLTAGNDSVIEFWEYRVLGISDGIEYMGTVRWDLCGCLLLAWIIVFACIIKGMTSFGKVVYVTATSPYLFMFILLVRAATLPGASTGLTYYMVPNITKLSEIKVWVDAGTQVFFSMSISLGTLPALGSYNDRNHNSLRDSFLFATVNSLTSLFAGFVIFLTLGFMSHKSGLPIDQVAASGPGLAFIAYPKALAQMPGAPVWSVLFFFMIILLGIDSQFVGVDGIITAIVDLVPGFMAKPWRRELFILATCLTCFLVGMSMVTNGGMYVFQIFDYYSGSRIILVVAALQCIAIMYVYGGLKFGRHIEKLFWYPKAVRWIFTVMWGFVSPVYILMIFIMSAVVYKELDYKRGTSKTNYKFPTYSISIGWSMAGISVAIIPIVTIYKFIRTEGDLFQRFRTLMTPLYPSESPLFAMTKKDPQYDHNGGCELHPAADGLEGRYQVGALEVEFVAAEVEDDNVNGEFEERYQGEGGFEGQPQDGKYEAAAVDVNAEFEERHQGEGGFEGQPQDGEYGAAAAVDVNGEFEERYQGGGDGEYHHELHNEDGNCTDV